MNPLRQSDSLEGGILKCLSYYDVFSYPLTAMEIFHSLDRNSTSPNAVEELSRQLATSGRVKEHEGFFGFGNIESQVERRVKGNKLASDSMPKADEWSDFISGFPFVRAVFLSGSLSKNYMEEDGDIDYFVITEPGKLWLARTILVLYKKIFLFNSHKYFCVNYFIDTDHLEIEEKNHFTAVELVTLIPTRGRELYARFISANQWAHDYFPNFPVRDKNLITETRKGFFKNAVEGLLNNRLGDFFDHSCMRFTVKFWKRKFSQFEKERFELALKSKPYVSKHHPNNFQKKVLDAFHERMATV